MLAVDRTRQAALRALQQGQKWWGMGLQVQSKTQAGAAARSRGGLGGRLACVTTVCCGGCPKLGCPAPAARGAQKSPPAPLLAMSLLTDAV